MDIRFDLLHTVFSPDADDLHPAIIPTGDVNGQPHDVRRPAVTAAEPRHPASTSHLEPVRHRAFGSARLFDSFAI